MPRADLATEFTVSVDNRPGELARVFSTLARGQVNIRAYTAYAGADRGYIKFTPSDPQTAVQAMDSAGLTYTQHQVLVVEAPERVGIGAEIASTIAEAGLNVTHSHASAAGPGTVLLVFSTDDNEKAKRAIGE